MDAAEEGKGPIVAVQPGFRRRRWVGHDEAGIAVGNIHDEKMYPPLNAGDDYIRRYKYDIRPATDARPYFFDFFRWRLLGELYALRDRGGFGLLEWGYPVKLGYHPLSRRFTVTDQRKKSTAVFQTLGEALRQLDRFSAIEALPAGMGRKKNLVVRIRARIDTESLPAPLRLMSALLPPWNEQSQWREWPVQ